MVEAINSTYTCNHLAVVLAQFDLTPDGDSLAVQGLYIYYIFNDVSLIEEQKTIHAQFDRFIHDAAAGNN